MNALETDYQHRVRKKFSEGWYDGDLYIELHEGLKPAELRNFCFNRYEKEKSGLDKKDKLIIKNFKNTYGESELGEISREKFKHLLDHYLVGGKETGTYKADFLAWAIDFKPRPYTFFRQEYYRKSVEVTQSSTGLSPEDLEIGKIRKVFNNRNFLAQLLGGTEEEQLDFLWDLVPERLRERLVKRYLEKTLLESFQETLHKEMQNHNKRLEQLILKKNNYGSWILFFTPISGTESLKERLIDDFVMDLEFNFSFDAVDIDNEEDETEF